jgi:hypothetical protein
MEEGVTMAADITGTRTAALTSSVVYCAVPFAMMMLGSAVCVNWHVFVVYVAVQIITEYLSFHVNELIIGTYR